MIALVALNLTFSIGTIVLFPIIGSAFSSMIMARTNSFHIMVAALVPLTLIIWYKPILSLFSTGTIGDGEEAQLLLLLWLISAGIAGFNGLMFCRVNMRLLTRST